MNKSKIAIFSLGVIFIIFGYRYYKVNHNMPLKYTMEYYKNGRYADCEGIKIRILSTEVKKSDDISPDGIKLVDLVVNSEIVNTSSKVKTAIDFQQSPIVIGYYSIETGPPELNSGDLQNIKPGERLRLKQIYTVEKDRYEKGKDNVYMYLAEKLYPNEIKKKFHEGIRYRKAIKI